MFYFLCYQLLCYGHRSLRRTLVLQQSLQQLLQQPAQSEAKGSVIVFIFYFTQGARILRRKVSWRLCSFASLREN